MDILHRLAFMGRRKFFLRKFPAECCEKGGAIVVTLLLPVVPREVTGLPPNEVAVCLIVHVRVCNRTPGMPSQVLSLPDWS